MPQCRSTTAQRRVAWRRSHHIITTQSAHPGERVHQRSRAAMRHGPLTEASWAVRPWAARTDPVQTGRATLCHWEQESARWP
jgi:hypothetical protein